MTLNDDHLVIKNDGLVAETFTMNMNMNGTLTPTEISPKSERMLYYTEYTKTMLQGLGLRAGLEIQNNPELINSILHVLQLTPERPDSRGPLTV